MENSLFPFDETAFVHQWAQYLKSRAGTFSALFSDILAEAQATDEKQCIRAYRATRPVSCWRDRALRLGAESGVPFFPGQEIPDKRLALSLCKAMEAAGIGRDPGPEFILTPCAAAAYENDAEPPVDEEEAPLLPGEAARVLFPAWYQGGKLLYKGVCVRVYSPFETETAFIRFEAYHEFSRDYYRNIGPNHAWIDFSFLSSPETKHRIDVDIRNPDDNWSVFQYDLSAGTILKAHLRVLLQSGSRLEAVRGGEAGNVFAEDFTGILTRLDRREKTFVLFVEGWGYIHCDCADDDLLPADLPLGSALRVRPSPAEQPAYIDPDNSLFASYPPNRTAQSALYDLRFTSGRLKAR